MRSAHANHRCLLPLFLLVMGACAAAPPPAPPPPKPAEPTLAVEILSEPPGARIERGAEPTRTAPVRIDPATMSEVLALRAESPGLSLIERRIRVLNESTLQVTFRFGTEATPLARALGLGRVTVFDYSGGALFEVNRSTLRPEALPLIARQAELLRGPFAGIRVFACGHTDSTGGEAHNLELSLARAQAVADVLVAGGVDRGRVAVQGFGWQYPVADNGSEEGRVLNRRAEVVLPDE